MEDSFDIEGVLNDFKSTHHACARWFSCENGLFVLVVGIGSLLHLYSLVETPSAKQGMYVCKTLFNDASPISKCWFPWRAS